jgi:CRP/FNR family transcriptional regulator, cyclic AMP receptor protein
VTMQSIHDLLAAHDFFAGLDPAYVDLIAGCGVNEHYEPGVVILQEGEPADHFYVVRTGLVAIEIHVPQRGALVVETLGPGEVLGWSWLVPPWRWRFDARALEPTNAIALDGACLRGKCENDPKLGYELMKRFVNVIEERLQAARLQLLDVYGPARAQ